MNATAHSFTCTACVVVKATTAEDAIVAAAAKMARVGLTGARTYGTPALVAPYVWHVPYVEAAPVAGVRF